MLQNKEKSDTRRYHSPCQTSSSARVALQRCPILCGRKSNLSVAFDQNTVNVQSRRRNCPISPTHVSNHADSRCLTTPTYSVGSNDQPPFWDISRNWNPLRQPFHCIYFGCFRHVIPPKQIQFRWGFSLPDNAKNALIGRFLGSFVFAKEFSDAFSVQKNHFQAFLAQKLEPPRGSVSEC